ncbi:MAG: AAA-like domain-containing protein [Verrucomicrobia bacterium]|nr:AAA-like domain-containing protein [Verrucomicrobiota bacterium]
MATETFENNPGDKSASTTDSPVGSPRVALIFRRDAAPDSEIVDALEKELISQGFSVWIDRNTLFGVQWAQEVEQQIRTAHAVVPILSNASARSEMVAFEIENAHESAQRQQGRPKLIPIRVGTVDPLPEPLAGILDPLKTLDWTSAEDQPALFTKLVSALKNVAAPAEPVRVVPGKGLRLVPRSSKPVRVVLGAPKPTSPRGHLPLEPIGGAVPLNSEFYITRPVDTELRNAVNRYDSIILVKGGRQIGKTSLLARGLQTARERGAKVALTDFQKFNDVNLENVSNFYLSLAESLADQMELSTMPGDVWDERRGPNINFERFIRREVLTKLNAPLVWGLDEVDRLFLCPYGSEVFGLFRSWHNERALDPSGPWAGLTLAIAYATEAHLFITDMNQSPFNIGTRLILEDFSKAHVTELNKRYSDPLKDETEIDRFVNLVGGHPFLVRRGLHELTTGNMDLSKLEQEADRDEGIFGDHLRRILVLLAKDHALTDVLRGLLQGSPCPTPESFYRLRSGGVILGSSQSDAQLRCQVYATFLKRHLL